MEAGPAFVGGTAADQAPLRSWSLPAVATPARCSVATRGCEVRCVWDSVGQHPKKRNRVEMMIERIALVDYENVQPLAEELQGVDVARHRLKIFHGPGQNSLPIRLAAALLPIGSAVELIQCEKPGKDALDFHLAFHLGRLSVQHPQAHFVIVSRDRKGFAQLVEHGIKLGCKVTLVPSLLDIAALKSPAKTLPEPASTPHRPTASVDGADARSGIERCAAQPATPDDLVSSDAAAEPAPTGPKPALRAEATATQVPAKQAVAKKAAAKAPVVKTTGVATAVARKTAAKKPATNETAARKTVARKAVPKKAVARKAPAKKTAAKTTATKKTAPAKQAAARTVAARQRVSAKTTAAETPSVAALPAMADQGIDSSLPLPQPVQVATPILPVPATASGSAPAVPAVAAPSKKLPRPLPTPADLSKAIDGLAKVEPAKRPGKIKTLQHHLESHFRADLTGAAVEELLRTLFAQRWISEGPQGKLEYHLPRQ